MKQKIISLAIVLLVTVLIVIEIKTFKGEINLDNMSNLTSTTNSLNDQLETITTEESEHLAEILGVESKYLTNVGQEIRDRKTFYRVNSWAVQTESPGYVLPTGITYETLINGNDELEFDENGNIISNNYYYVIVNASVRNSGESSMLFQANCIGLMGIRDKKYWYRATSEVKYLGEDVLRKYDKEYMKLCINPEKELSFNLVYLVSSTLVDDKQLFIHINPSGSTTVNTDMSVYSSQRFILLD